MKKKNAVMLILAAALVCQPMSVFADAAPDGMTDASQTAAAQGGAWEAWSEEWETIKNDWTQVSMSPGADETKMNFAWYSRTGEAAEFIYGTAGDLSDGQAATVTQTSAQDGYMSNKVTLENLKPGTTYYYQVAGKEIESFTTDDDTADFSFIFVGDPQIGSSNAEKAKKPEDIKKPTFVTAQSEAVRNDTFNWNYTLNRAYAKTGNKAGFILSSGDQIQTNAEKVQDPTVSEMEYAGYLSPDIMKSVPVATTVGNHDADNQNYQYHFNITNLSNLGNNDYNVGGDYYFTYGDALFIILNTQDTNVAEHKEFIEKTVAANADCRWRIVTLHQDIYGSAEHSNEPEASQGVPGEPRGSFGHEGEGKRGRGLCADGGCGFSISGWKMGLSECGFLRTARRDCGFDWSLGTGEDHHTAASAGAVPSTERKDPRGQSEGGFPGGISLHPMSVQLYSPGKYSVLRDDCGEYADGKAKGHG